MNLLITEVDNGFIVSPFSITEGKTVIDHEGSHAIVGQDRELMKDLLTYIGELLGESYDKFGSENLNVTFDKKGHKAE